MSDLILCKCKRCALTVYHSGGRPPILGSGRAACTLQGQRISDDCLQSPWVTWSSLETPRWTCAARGTCYRHFSQEIQQITCTNHYQVGMPIHTSPHSPKRVWIGRKCYSYLPGWVGSSSIHRDNNTLFEILRWQTQRGVVTIPKSVTESRIKENIQVCWHANNFCDVNISYCVSWAMP